MTTDGGGWTLLFNDGTDFVADQAGEEEQTCFESLCANRAYSRLPLGADMMFDAADVPMSSDDELATRGIITGIHHELSGETLAHVLTHPGPGPDSGWPVEAQDNSNLVAHFSNGGSCDEPDSWLDGEWTPYLLCGSRVIILNDGESPTGSPGNGGFLIGMGDSYSVGHGNMAGWPQMPIFEDVRFYPDYFRIWTRNPVGDSKDEAI